MTTKVPGRKRGAQPGNKNSFKHGLYTKRTLSDEPLNIDLMDKDLDGEIAVLRTHIFGLGEALEGTQYNELDINRLTVLGDLIIKLASVVRTQAWLTGGVSPTARNAVAAIFIQRDKWAKILK